MPTAHEIITEKQKILRFCEEEFTKRSGDGCSSYGEADTPIRFSLWFEGDSTVVINHVVTHSQWQKRGLFTFLLIVLETGRGIRRVGVKSANSADIQSIIKKRAYILHPDNDCIKTIYDPNEVVALDDLPAWLGKVVSWFRKKHLEFPNASEM
jgi:hypothetical protein